VTVRPGRGGAHVPAAAASLDAVPCRNCGAPLGGAYCAACGQRNGSPEPTFRELAAEAWEAFVDVDGRVATTLRLLLTRPGELTAQYLAGRRARFLSPLRLYLTCSLAFFLLDAALPDGQGALAVDTRGQVVGARDALSADDAAAGVSGPEWSRRVQRGLRRSAADQRGFTARLRERAPQVIFALVPWQGALVAAAYRRRRRTFPAHLVFALHVHAFVYCLLAAAAVVGWALPGSDGWTDAVVLAGVAAYLPVAMRRVYGGRWRAALLRAAAVGAVYVAGAVAVMAALLVATFYAMGAAR
jgi:hypothetical protein